ncbi:MAG: hypothetical protein QOC96_3776 [Acidobacteriota bacterium]|jgi:hypothetical protein|nr:hypothetical protein [Acidobacteriota bacterium]
MPALSNLIRTAGIVIPNVRIHFPGVGIDFPSVGDDILSVRIGIRVDSVHFPPAERS